MAEAIQAGAQAIVMDSKDHVATAIKDLAQDETINYQLLGQTHELTAAEQIPFGHKIAIVDIAAGTLVRKYGEVIGRATSDIAKGQHVHVHNMEGIRGRGDQAAAATAGGDQS